MLKIKKQLLKDVGILLLLLVTFAAVIGITVYFFPKEKIQEVPILTSGKYVISSEKTVSYEEFIKMVAPEDKVLVSREEADKIVYTLVKEDGTVYHASDEVPADVFHEAGALAEIREGKIIVLLRANSGLTSWVFGLIPIVVAIIMLYAIGSRIKKMKEYSEKKMPKEVM